MIVVALAPASCFSTSSLEDVIFRFAFMSMGLRGAVVFVPLCCALWMKGRVRPVFAMVFAIAGPLAVIVGNMLAVLFDPLFIGIAAGFVIMTAGLWLSGSFKDAAS